MSLVTIIPILVTLGIIPILYLQVEDKQEPSTTYYGSDGSSCLQSDETYSSSSSTERSRQPAGPLHSYTGQSTATGHNSQQIPTEYAGLQISLTRNDL